jgi:hypothetical protein
VTTIALTSRNSKVSSSTPFLSARSLNIFQNSTNSSQSFFSQPSLSRSTCADTSSVHRESLLFLFSLITVGFGSVRKLSLMKSKPKPSSMSASLSSPPSTSASLSRQESKDHEAKLARAKKAAERKTRQRMGLLRYFCCPCLRFLYDGSVLPEVLPEVSPYPLPPPFLA